MKTKKSKSKSKTWKILKIVWFSFGGLSLAWTLFILITMQSIPNLGAIFVYTIFLAYGIIGLITFISVTIIYLIIKFIIKLIRKIRK